MQRDVPSRSIGDLTSPEILRCLRASSILCMPIGSIEQHGPHLPLNTDAVLAEEFTRRIISRWGKTFDLWQLPSLMVSFAREHEWAPGTLSLSLQSMTMLIRAACRQSRYHQWSRRQPRPAHAGAADSPNTACFIRLGGSRRTRKERTAHMSRSCPTWCAASIWRN